MGKINAYGVRRFYNKYNSFCRSKCTYIRMTGMCDVSTWGTMLPCDKIRVGTQNVPLPGQLIVQLL